MTVKIKKLCATYKKHILNLRIKTENKSIEKDISCRHELCGKKGAAVTLILNKVCFCQDSLLEIKWNIS